MMVMTLSNVALSAQEARYMWDFGGGVGVSGYNGDANSGFPFCHPGITASLQGRYNLDSRWSFRTQIGVSTLKGSTADVDNYLPDGATYSFKSTLFDATVSGEFNFFPYGIGESYKRLRRWSPFVSVGCGVVVSRVDGEAFTAASLPLGLGVKYKISPRVNLVGEVVFAKVLGDHIDGAALSDLYAIKSSFLKNTDWYSSVCVSLTYEFGERCTVCNRHD